MSWRYSRVSKAEVRVAHLFCGEHSKQIVKEQM